VLLGVSFVRVARGVSLLGSSSAVLGLSLRGVSPAPLLLALLGLLRHCCVRGPAVRLLALLNSSSALRGRWPALLGCWFALLG